MRNIGNRAWTRVFLGVGTVILAGVALLLPGFLALCSPVEASPKQAATALCAAGNGTTRGSIANPALTELSGLVREMWTARTDRYSETRSLLPAPRRKIEMSYIGG